MGRSQRVVLLALVAPLGEERDGAVDAEMDGAGFLGLDVYPGRARPTRPDRRGFFL